MDGSYARVALVVHVGFMVIGALFLMSVGACALLLRADPTAFVAWLARS